MAADEEDQDAVRRILQDRPPETLPKGAKTRLRKRLDEEAHAARQVVTRPARKPAAAKRTGTKKKTARSR